jgi:hypothetical protein
MPHGPPAAAHGPVNEQVAAAMIQPSLCIYPHQPEAQNATLACVAPVCAPLTGLPAQEAQRERLQRRD